MHFLVRYFPKGNYGSGVRFWGLGVRFCSLSQNLEEGLGCDLRSAAGDEGNVMPRGYPQVSGRITRLDLQR